ncbi:MAG: glycosyltransferase family 4 protein [Candidatus Doudnabacteria bacterium]|nr:glycosyltransferase family 4 protein [Candidatus Doudnabacteria bacterium]
MIFFFKFPLQDSLGGAEFHTLKLAKHFQSLGHAVKLITSDAKLFRLFEKHRLPRQRLFVGWEPTSKLSLFLWPLTYLIAGYKFRKLVKQISPGATFFMQSLTEKLILSPLILQSEILNQKSKIVWLEHKIPGRWLKLNPLKSHYLKLARRIELVTVSNFAMQEFVKLGILKKTIKVIYPGVDAISHKLLPKTFFTIGLLSRLAPEKGVLDFFQTILPTLKDHPDWKIIIGGEGEERQKIEFLISNYHLENQIKLLGFVNDLDEFFLQISVFVYPTKVPEAFGVAVLEAAARGVPVVGSEIGALPEMIEDKKSGFLIEPNEPAMWSAVLIQLRDLLFYEEFRKKTSVKAQRFSEESMLAGFENLIF